MEAQLWPWLGSGMGLRGLGWRITAWPRLKEFKIPPGLAATAGRRGCEGRRGGEPSPLRPTHVLGGELDAGAVVLRDLSVAPLGEGRQRGVRLPGGDTVVWGPSASAHPPFPPPSPQPLTPGPALPGRGRGEAQRRVGAAELDVGGPRAPALPPLPLIVVPGALGEHGGAGAAQRARGGGGGRGPPRCRGAHPDGGADAGLTAAGPPPRPLPP